MLYMGGVDSTLEDEQVPRRLHFKNLSTYYHEGAMCNLDIDCSSYLYGVLEPDPDMTDPDINIRADP